MRRRLPLFKVFDKIVAENLHEKDVFLARLEVLKNKSSKKLRKLCTRVKPLLVGGHDGADLLIYLEQKIVRSIYTLVHFALYMWRRLGFFIV